ncbi:MAG TPA: DNA polymerase III subunit beta [Candidatus Fimimorpha faecalis]|uniref:Beta sliding clamp n=1 Tax=Candidatus Fimimorpha faecalis TaxID=2840824 RepID=A0A9D1JDC8_9FIRM|nr:DNA polymerase III subunit beta [Candidatus Fimimorpha faecalis]
MKLICQKDHLQKGVSIVSKAVSSKTTMPILQCVLLTAQDGEITITGNDLELGIETTINGTIEEEGIVALEAKLFAEIVRRLPNNEVLIEVDENFATTIVCEKAKFTIAGQSGEDFAYLPQVERTNPVVLSQFTLKEIIRQTIFSIADNEANKMMSGELMEINENRMKLVSLDGHRISIRNIKLKDHYEPIKAVIPGKTLNEVSKILTGDTESEVSLFFTPNHIIFEFDQTIVVSRLIEGEYFRINQMLNSDYDTKLVINKKEFLNCIDRSTLLVKENDKKPIIINISDNKMEVKLKSTIGTLNEEISIHKVGKDIMIGFNPRFLIDTLRVIDDEEVTLYMINPKAPCFIKDEKESYTYLILPVNFVV